MSKKVSYLISAVAVAVGMACAPSAHAVTVFTATLDGAQEAPGPGSPTATGFANFILNDAQTTLSWNATISGIDFTGSQSATTSDNLVNAHIHRAPPGVAGPVIWGFIGTPFNDTNPTDTVVTPFPTGLGGTVSSKWDAAEGNATTLTAELANLLAGNTYINFHTVQFPGGALRGQIVQVIPEPGTLALLATALVASGGVMRKRSRSVS